MRGPESMTIVRGPMYLSTTANHGMQRRSWRCSVGGRRLDLIGAVVILASVFTAGCLGSSVGALADLPGMAPGDLAEVFPVPSAALIAVGGSVQITPSAVAFDGTPITTFDSVKYQLYTSSDTARVVLSPTGLVTGRVASTVSV